MQICGINITKQVTNVILPYSDQGVGGGGAFEDPIAKKLKNFKTVQAVNTKLSDIP